MKNIIFRWGGVLLFLLLVASNTVSVIDMKSMQVIKNIEAGDAPHGVTLSPDGKELWVSNNKSNDVTVSVRAPFAY